MQTIKYQEKQYPLKGGYYALKHTQQELKEKGEELNLARIMAGDMIMLEPLLYYSLVMGAKLAGSEMTLPREEMEFMMDEVWAEFIRMLPDMFPTEEALGKSDSAPEVKEPEAAG